MAIARRDYALEVIGRMSRKMEGLDRVIGCAQFVVEWGVAASEVSLFRLHIHLRLSCAFGHLGQSIFQGWLRNREDGI